MEFTTVLYTVTALLQVLCKNKWPDDTHNVNTKRNLASRDVKKTRLLPVRITITEQEMNCPRLNE
jgi:hypothetical protein